MTCRCCVCVHQIHGAQPTLFVALQSTHACRQPWGKWGYVLTSSVQFTLAVQLVLVHTWYVSTLSKFSRIYLRGINIKTAAFWKYSSSDMHLCLTSIICPTQSGLMFPEPLRERISVCRIWATRSVQTIPCKCPISSCAQCSLRIVKHHHVKRLSTPCAQSKYISCKR